MSVQPNDWLTEQHKQRRQLLLIVDTVAAPHVIGKLFELGTARDYIRLFQGTEFESLLEQSPWLVGINGISKAALAHLLQSPQDNWGWIASAEHLDLNEVAQHWRERMVISEGGQRWFYRFQDNVVISRHLNALSPADIPLLLGPLAATLCWNGEHWQQFENDHPAVYPAPFATPWLAVPESAAASRAIEIRAMKKWLWNKHPHATYHLPVFIEDWIEQQLDLASEWGWNDAEQIFFLAEHKLDPERAEHAAWAKQTGETPEEHFQRANKILTHLYRAQKIE
ncbi:DUF4123 domain-containing protein [Pseudomonas syringae]|uniref:DUF4123 domain-containing protein n=1 Tax=Pseudomonas syringae TaxID=317 RepID=A0A085V001_PSESX|nr:DUF4123 domain-containing protein [Pseudomonas syringae]KFE48764.1 hypothetical protein IV02_21210 [Pseudomonas syringae]